MSSILKKRAQVLVSDTALSVLLTATTALAATEDRADKEGKTKIANGVGFKVYKNSLEDAVKAEALKQIGRIRSREYEWDIALENYETSLEILNRFGNLCEIGNIYNATGFNESVINQRPNFWHTDYEVATPSQSVLNLTHGKCLASGLKCSRSYGFSMSISESSDAGGFTSLDSPISTHHCQASV